MVVVNMINDAKSKYYEDKIQQCQSQKDIFKVVESLLHQKGNVKLPSHTCQQELAHRFNDYFVSKISKIRHDLDTIAPIAPVLPTENNVATLMISFTPATDDEICKLVSSSPSKSCTLDPIPTWMLKDHLNIMVPVITKIVNLS